MDRKNNNQSGWAIIDVLIGITLFALLMPIMLNYLNSSTEELVSKNVAEHLNILAKATEEYVKVNYTTLQSGATASHAVEININDLKTGGYLPTNFSSINAWGQSYRIWVLEPVNGSLEVIILTYGGRSHSGSDLKFSNIIVPKTASKIGAKGGYIPTGTIAGQNSNVIQGAFGGWKKDISGTNIVNPGAGHLAVLSYFDEGILSSDYLYRVFVPGHPEYNRMETALDMNGFQIVMNDGEIVGVKDLQLNQKTTADINCVDSANEGKLFFDKNNGLYICRNGNARVVADSGNAGFFQNSRLACSGDIIAKPSCVNGMTPQVFVAPVLFSKGATSKPLASVQAWAEDSGSDWRVKIRVLTEDGWTTPTCTYGKVIVFTVCQ